MAMAPSISVSVGRSLVGRSLGSLLSWEVLSNSPAAKRSEITKILRITAVRSILPAESSTYYRNAKHLRKYFVLPQYVELRRNFCESLLDTFPLPKTIHKWQDTVSRDMGDLYLIPWDRVEIEIYAVECAGFPLQSWQIHSFISIAISGTITWFTAFKICRNDLTR